MDIDLACNNKAPLIKILKALNFEHIGRHYFSNELNIAIEIPTSYILNNQEERLYIIEIDNYEIPILGIEDIIIDRLNAFTHWQSLEDGRIAKELLLIQYDKIDWNYLESQTQSERVNKALQNIKQELKEERKNYEN
jgi:hypothetical protein